MKLFDRVSNGKIWYDLDEETVIIIMRLALFVLSVGEE